MNKILVVDDHRLFLDGLYHLLKCLGDDYEIVGCSSVSHAIEQLDKGEHFRLIMVDIAMPGMDGFAFLHALRERRSDCAVVVVSANADRETVRRALHYGALGFIHKSDDSNAMLAGIKSVMRGDLYLSETLWPLINDEPLLSDDDTDEQCGKEDSIGPRQLEVLSLLADGLSNKQIASVLSISEATVKYHIGILFRALGVTSRTACIREAQRKGVIETS